MEEPDDGSIAMEPKQEQKTESYENYSTDNVPERNQELPIIPPTSTENKEPIADHLDEEDNKKILLETEPIDIVLEEGTVEQLNDGKTSENSSNMELKLGKHEIMDNDEMKSEHEETTPDLDDLDNDAPDTPFTIDDLTDITTQEGKESGELEGEQKLIRPRLVNPTELSCCEYCQGPVKKRRLCSPLKKFCSKACARNCRKAKKEDEGQDGQMEESAGAEGDFKMTWDDYLRAASSKAAPESCFKHTTTDVPGLKPGMKLEAVDRNNPPSYCVATVIKCVGHRVCIRYDGYGSDSSNDIWCNFQAEELHPIGWCAQNGYPLQPPKGVGSSLEAWRTFLTQTLTGALAAPQDLFKKSQEHFQPRVHGFEVGMKLEAIHPLRPSIICPATVTKSLGPYYFAVTPDFQHDLPPTTFCCHSDSPGIFPVGWCYRNGIELTYPANYTKKTFSWQKYLSVCRALAAPSQLFKKVKAHKFKVGMKVEAVDIEQPSVICVATITNVIGRLLLLFFDGRSRFQFVDVESPDLYPIGWCKRTGHPLDTPFGVMPATLDAKAKSVEQEVLYLPSFDEVMGRQVPQTLQNQSHLALSSRKPTTRPDQEKDKEKDKDKEREDNHGDFESEEKSGESDMSEDDCLASERFYHNKNQIFFNKGCCIGPLLNPERVKLLPDATPPGKVSTVIRTGLEMVAKAALDPEKVIDLMQEGCGVRVTIKHEGKLLKKAISRVDSRPKLERYLKRFCRRLICCEYFLSLKPVGQPCPDQCKADDQGNLQGPKGLKAKRSREYFEVKHLGFEKKKRGRRKKVDILSDASSSTAVKKTMIENGASGSVAPVISTSSNRQLAPAYHLPHNGNVIPRPVTTSTLPGVQAPVVRYQGPGNVAVVRPNTNLHMGGRVSGTAIATAHSPHIVVAAATVQGNTKVVKQDGVLPQSRIIMADPVSPGPNKTRIVTNISGQTFATSSSGSGTTITFGRAPPNVTVSSSAVPPPLTRISNTVESISVPTEKGGIGPTTSPLIQPAVTPKGSGVLSLAAVSHAAHPRGPPNVVVSASQGMMTTSGGTVQVSVSDTSTGLYTSSNTPVSGVIRAPIVVPPQVKQETPPPPPLVHASKVSPGLRMVGASGVVSSSNVTLPTSSFSHPRSLPQKVYPSAAIGESRSPHSTYTNTGHLVSPSVPGQTSRTLYIRSNTPAKSVTAVTSNKHLMPRYQSFAQRISPKPQTAIQTGSIRITQDVVKPQSPVFSAIGQTSRPIMAKPGVIQTIHHNPVSIAPSSSPVKPRAGPLPTSQSFVHSTTLEKIRAGIKPSLGHVERTSEEKNKPSNSHEEGNKEKDELGMKDKDIGEEQGDGKDEQPKKRNLWWLKKRKRKRSRLTYMKTKYRKKDDGTGGDESGVKEESHPDFSDYQDELGSPDRPKRGRMNELNDIVLAFEEDGDGLSPMIDEEDPDWDESAERRKAKQNMRTKKRGFGRNRKDGETDLSPTLSNPPSPFSPTTLHSPLSLCTGSKQLPNDNKSLIMKLDPAPSRRPVTVAMDHRNDLGPKVKSPRSASYSTPDAHGPGHHSTGYPSRTIRSTSSHTSPLSPKSPSFNRQSVPKRVVDVGVNTSLPGCLNVRSPELPSNPVTWTVDDVITYVRSTDCSHYAPIFQEEEIDGQALLMLSRDALMQFTPMKLGPTLKMCSYISQLRLRAK